MEQNKLIPLSILAAGIIIAVSVFFVGKSSTSTEEQKTATVPTSGKEIRGISEADHLRGNPEAPVIIVEYSDFECPFCQRFHKDLKTVMDTRGKSGDLAWVYRHFPLQELHSKAPFVSLASECVANLGGNDAFWNFADTYYETTPSNNQVDLSILPSLASGAGVDKDAFGACLTETTYQKEVDTDFAEARAAGGTGTPFSVFIFKEPIKDEVKKLAESFNAQYGNALFSVITENQLGMSGALPADIVALIVDTQTGKVAQ